MARHENEIEREQGKPFAWGWDDESVFFVFDPYDYKEPVKRLQDHPELWAKILATCEEYFRGKEGS